MGGVTLERFRRQYDKGSIIFEEGSVGDAVFLIDEGTVRVLKESDGLERVITTLEDGAIVGEMGLLDEQHHRTATVKADSPVKGWKLPRDQFRSIIDRHEDFRRKLIDALIDRLNRTTDQLAEALDREVVLPRFATLLLATLDAEELEDEEPAQLVVNADAEYLAYRFGTSLEVMNDFLSLPPDFELKRKDPETREKLFAVAERIVDKGLEQILLQADPDEDGSPQLVQATRRAREHLDKLTQEDEELARDELTTIMEERKELHEVLENKGGKNFTSELLETLLNSIKREINRRHNA